MSEESLPLIAATEWARANTCTGCDPVAFGRNVALAYLAARATRHYYESDKLVTALAALARLSAPAEAQQSPAPLSEGRPLMDSIANCQTGSVDSQEPAA